MGAREEIGSIIAELYSIISGPAGHQPNWRREAELFLPTAYMIRTSVDEEGVPQATRLHVSEYPKNFTKLMAGRSFYELEVQNIIEVFGNIAHAFSTYEAWEDAEQTRFVKRGINSIQFYNDGQSWRVVSMMWDDERPGLVMDDRYTGATPNSSFKPSPLRGSD